MKQLSRHTGGATISGALAEPNLLLFPFLRKDVSIMKQLYRVRTHTDGTSFFRALVEPELPNKLSGLITIRYSLLTLRVNAAGRDPLLGSLVAGAVGIPTGGVGMVWVWARSWA